MKSSKNPPPAARSAWSVLSYPQFRWMFAAQFVTQTAAAITVATVDWHIWGLTQDKLALGLVGLVRVVPIILLSLLGGVVSDAVDRRKLLTTTEFLTLLVIAFLAIIVLTGHESVVLIYAATATIAGLAAFGSPARFAILPSLVPADRIADAARLSVVLFTTTSVLGPLVGSMLLALTGPGLAYGVAAVLVIPSVLVLLSITLPPIKSAVKPEISVGAMKEGLNHIFSTPLLWSSMILDFVATFFASALALLPVYATQVLIKDVPSSGLLSSPEFRYGLLRAAPFIGSALGAVFMAQYGGRIMQQGKVMLASVAIYGLATVIFGASEVFTISLLALATLGFADSVSAAIRNALRQVLTPSRLRGRMQSVMMIFFLGGPQLGEFEAGAVAKLTSTSFSVISGGVATVLAVAAMAFTIPALRNYHEIPGQVEEVEQAAEAEIERSEEIEGTSAI